MIRFIYNQCLKLGNAIGYSTLEGFILYVSVIMLGITTVISKKSDKK